MVGHVACEHLPRQARSVDDPIGERFVAARQKSHVEESDVEARVVGHDHRVTQEFQERGEHRLDGGRFEEHRVRDAGKQPDERRHRFAWVDQGLEGPQDLAAAHFDRPHLGDGGRSCGGPGGLEVEDGEGDLGQGGPHVV